MGAKSSVYLCRECGGPFELHGNNVVGTIRCPKCARGYRTSGGSVRSSENVAFTCTTCKRVEELGDKNLGKVLAKEDGIHCEKCGELLREQLTNRQYKRLEYTVDGKKSVLVRQQGTPQSAQPLPSQTRHPLQPKQHAKPKPGYLRGVEVIDHTSFTYMGQAQSFDWVNHGFKLHLPENALPPEVDKCKVHVKVSLTGEFQFPDGSEVISGIYWIYAPHVFVQPVTVEIQHCVQLESPQDSDDLALVVAKCSQKNLPYQFKVLEGGVFSPHSSYGSIQVTHFCGIGAIRRNNHRTRTQKCYCAKLYYILKNRTRWDVHFVITLNMDLHISAVHSEYADMGAKVGSHQEVMFAGKEITLDIPLEGITLDSGWTITPLVHPGIMKYQVDRFVPGKRVPACQLSVKWSGQQQQSVELMYSMKLVGAKEPYNFFFIQSPASTPIPGVTDDPVTHIGPGERPNLLKLLNFPSRCGQDVSIPRQIGTKYSLFGVLLLNDETGTEISTIAARYRDDAEQINLEILRLWIGGKGKPLSWNVLVDVLKATGLNTLAGDIQDRLQH